MEADAADDPGQERRGPGALGVKSRVVVISLEVVAGLLVGLAILGGLLIWRLSAGPVSLKFLTPALEEAINEDLDTFDIKIEETVLTWAGWERAIDILARNVEVQVEGGLTAAVLPQVSFGLSLQALTKGKLIPTKVDLIAPKITLVRDERGSFAFGFYRPEGAGESDLPDFSFSELAGLLDQSVAPEGSTPLRRLSVLGADIEIDDRFSQTRLLARDANLVFVGDELGTRGTMSARLELPDGVTRISGGLYHASGEDAFSITIRFAELKPNFVARLIPELEVFSRVRSSFAGSIGGRVGFAGDLRSTDFNIQSDLGSVSGDIVLSPDGESVRLTTQFIDVSPQDLAESFPPLEGLSVVDARLSGALTVLGDLNGTIVSLDFDIKSGPGTLTLEEYFPEPVQIDGMAARGSARARFDEIRVDEAEIQFENDARLRLSGLATRIDAKRVLVGDAQLSDMPWDKVARYWPANIGSDAREWITKNIVGGQVPEATLHAEIQLPMEDDAALIVDDLSGTVLLNDTSVQVLDTLPPVAGVNAVGTYGADWFNIQVSSGTMDSLHLDSARILITEIGTVDQTSVSARIKGPLERAMWVLDQEPFGFVSALGLEIEDFSGDVAADISLDFPITFNLGPNDIVASGQATATDVVIRKAFFDFDLTEGALDMTVDNEGMDVAGAAMLNGQPVTLGWRENFSSEAPQRATVSLTGTIDEAGLAMFGLPIAGLFDGPVDLRVDISSNRDNSYDAVISAGLDNASFGFEAFDWEKPAGVPGSAAAAIRVVLGEPAMITSFDVRAGDLTAKGVAELNPRNDAVHSVTIQDLRFADNEVKGKVIRSDDGEFRIDVEGRRFDVGQFVDPKQVEEEEPGPPIILNAQVDVLTAGPDRRLDNVVLNLRHDGENLQIFTLDSIVEGGGRLEVRYLPDGSEHTLTIKAEDAGRALRSFDWYEEISGGTLVLEGRRASLDEPLIGEVQVESYRLVKAPAMARLLQLVSLGLPEMTDEGLPFKRLDAKFCYLDGLITILRARAYGQSIGVTVEGSYDILEDSIAVRGTVAPASALTNIIKEIPGLGPLLGGDEGIIAATYSVRGKAEDPEIEVNESAVFAIGALRNAFKPPLDEQKRGEAVRHACGEFDKNRSYDVQESRD